MILKIFVKSKNEQMTLYLLARIKMFKWLLAILTSKKIYFLLYYIYISNVLAINISNNIILVWLTNQRKYGRYIAGGISFMRPQTKSSQGCKLL